MDRHTGVPARALVLNGNMADSRVLAGRLAAPCTWEDGLQPALRTLRRRLWRLTRLRSHRSCTCTKYVGVIQDRFRTLYDVQAERWAHAVGTV